MNEFKKFKEKKLEKWDELVNDSFWIYEDKQKVKQFISDLIDEIENEIVAPLENEIEELIDDKRELEENINN